MYAIWGQLHLLELVESRHFGLLGSFIDWGFEEYLGRLSEWGGPVEWRVTILTLFATLCI